MMETAKRAKVNLEFRLVKAAVKRRGAMNHISRREFLFGAAAFGLGGWRLFAAPSGWKHGGKPNLVFGILADTHFRMDSEWRRGIKTDRFRVAALEYFRSQNVDAVVHCGDMADRGLVEEMRLHADAWRRVFPENRTPDGHVVEKLFVTGNHDIDAWHKGFDFTRFVPNKAEWPEKVLNTDIAGHWRRSDGKWMGGGDNGITKVPLEGKLQGGKWEQGLVVRVYDDMLTIERREFSEGGSLGVEWVMPLEREEGKGKREEERIKKPHPFSKDELKKVIGEPQFRKSVKLKIESVKLESGDDAVKVSIPLADGNPDSRVYAYEVVVTGDEGTPKLYKAVYAAGCNMGIGHEPNGGVTTLDIPKSELPPGKTLTFAVRPLTSLGTAGKAIATEFKV